MSSSHSSGNVAKFVADNALAALNSALSSCEKPTSEGALARGKIFEITGDKEKAIYEYIDASKDISSLEPLSRLTIAQLQAGHYKSALSNAIKLSAKDDKYSVISLALAEKYSSMTLLADALLLNNRPDEAVKAYSKALTINPDDTFSAGRLAHLYLAQGQPAKAVALAPLVAKNPRFCDLASMLSLTKGDPSMLPKIEIAEVVALAGSSSAGRPLTVDGEPKFARITKDDSWCISIPPLHHDLTINQRREAASSWLSVGLNEHAAVASFARFSMQLLSLGAPPDLLLDTINGMADEVAHTRLAFSLGRNFAGKPFGIAEIDLSGVLAGDNDPREIVRNCLSEGCVVETISVHQASAALETVKSTQVKSVLQKIVTDEMKHSELAWRFVEWALSKYPDLIDELELIPQTYAKVVGSIAQSEETGTELEGLGVLSNHDKLRIAVSTFRGVIWPRAKAVAQKMGYVWRHPAPEFTSPEEEALSELLSAA